MVPVWVGPDDAERRPPAVASYPRSGRKRPVVASGRMSPTPRSSGFARGIARPQVVALVCLLSLSACGTISTSAPAPTPADFQGIATELTIRRIAIDDLVSGDAGCTDRVLIPTAIGLTAKGLDQTTPVRLYLYIFRDRAAFERLRATVDDCARSYVTDPQTFESIDASPFVLAGQGPWAPEFKAALREALVRAAGTGD